MAAAVDVDLASGASNIYILIAGFLINLAGDLFVHKLIIYHIFRIWDLFAPGSWLEAPEWALAEDSSFKQVLPRVILLGTYTWVWLVPQFILHSKLNGFYIVPDCQCHRAKSEAVICAVSYTWLGTPYSSVALLWRQRRCSTVWAPSSLLYCLHHHSRTTTYNDIINLGDNVELSTKVSAKSKTKITNDMQWNYAWMKYSAAVLFAYPHKKMSSSNMVSTLSAISLPTLTACSTSSMILQPENSSMGTKISPLPTSTNYLLFHLKSYHKASGRFLGKWQEHCQL